MRYRTPTLTRRLAACLLAFGLLATACGDDDNAAEAPAGIAVEAGADDAAGDGTGGGTDDGNLDGAKGGGTDSAVVTLGTGEQFVFDEAIVCVGLFGAASGAFINAEGVEFFIDVPPEDWETDTSSDWQPPSLTLRDERDEMNWRIFESGPELGATYPGTPAEEAVITTYSVEGSGATGNGFVIDTFGLTRAMAEGTELPTAVPVEFEFACS